MRYLSKAVGTISGSHPSSFTSIIDVWAKATPVVCKNLLSQQHLVGLCCVDSTSKRIMVIHLPQIEIFHNFDKLACSYSDFPKGMKWVEIKKIPSADTALPPNGNDPLRVVSLPSAVLVSYSHGLQLCKVTNDDLRFSTESYHLLMGLRSDTLAYQFSSVTGLSGLTQKKSNVPDNRGFDLRKSGALQVVTLLEDCDEDDPFIINIEQHLDMFKNSNIAAWLQDHPNWVDLVAAAPPTVGKAQHAAACVHSI
eukprot:12064405-Ditylum_brightwellii.AAC.1